MLGSRIRTVILIGGSFAASRPGDGNTLIVVARRELHRTARRTYKSEATHEGHSVPTCCEKEGALVVRFLSAFGVEFEAIRNQSVSRPSACG